jgi:hypothetical protein
MISAQSSTPDFSGKDVSIAGFALSPIIDLKNLNDFRKVSIHLEVFETVSNNLNLLQVVPNTPASNIAWKMEGKLVVVSGGSYILCTSSHDGLFSLLKI